MRDVGAIRGAGQLAGYVSQQTSYAAVVGTVHDRAPLSHTDVQNVSDLLGFFYPIRVMDSGNQASSSAFHGAVNSADVLVIPVLEAIDSVNGAHQLARFLHRYEGHPKALAQNAIVLRVDDGRPVAPATRSYVTEALESAGIRQVINIPMTRTSRSGRRSPSIGFALRPPTRTRMPAPPSSPSSPDV